MKKTGYCPQCRRTTFIEKMGGLICSNCRLIIPDAFLFEVGDVVRIRQVGQNYDQYKKWAKRYDIYDRWKDNHSPHELAYAANHGHKFVIRVAKPHSYHSEKTIYGIEDLETGYWYNIGPEGLENTGEVLYYEPIVLDDALFEI